MYAVIVQGQLLWVLAAVIAACRTSHWVFKASYCYDAAELSDLTYFGQNSMGLKTCADCGKEVSTAAKACPRCGAPVGVVGAKLRGLKFLAIAFVFFALVGFIFVQISPASKTAGDDLTQSPVVKTDPKTAALKGVRIVDLVWEKVGFDNVMQIDAALVNVGAYDVKDLELVCSHVTNSDTKVGESKKVIYEILRSRKSLVINKFNMGFIHQQAVKSDCYISGVVMVGESVAAGADSAYSLVIPPVVASLGGSAEHFLQVSVELFFDDEDAFVLGVMNRKILQEKIQAGLGRLTHKSLKAEADREGVIRSVVFKAVGEDAKVKDAKFSNLVVI